MLSLKDQKTLLSLVGQWPQNAWLLLYREHLDLYARCGIHTFNKTTYDTFDIANILIPHLHDRGQGWLTEILDFLEPRFNIYVESIQQPRLIPYLKRRGYKFDKGEFNAIKIVDPDIRWEV